MKQFNQRSRGKAHLALTAGMVLAMAFTVSCSSDGGSENIGTCGGREYDTRLGYSCVNGELVGSCRGKDYYPEYEHCENGEVKEGTAISSSSGGGGSSPSGGGNTFADSRDGKTYKTVKIGTQTWMAENLNYNASGSKCYGEGGEVTIGEDENYNPITTTLSPTEVQANCTKYGRLYDWYIAKTACPPGWHLPSNDDWQTLMNFAGGEEIAGKKLKATSGWNWNDRDNVSGNGTDEYGFSALPSGYGVSNVGFERAGLAGWWWSASENENISNDAYYLRMVEHSYELAWGSRPESILHSVRCVKD